MQPVNYLYQYRYDVVVGGHVVTVDVYSINPFWGGRIGPL